MHVTCMLWHGKAECQHAATHCCSCKSGLANRLPAQAVVFPELDCSASTWEAYTILSSTQSWLSKVSNVQGTHQTLQIWHMLPDLPSLPVGVLRILIPDLSDIDTTGCGQQ